MVFVSWKYNTINSTFLWGSVCYLEMKRMASQYAAGEKTPQTILKRDENNYDGY